MFTALQVKYNLHLLTRFMHCTVASKMRLCLCKHNTSKLEYVSTSLYSISLPARKSQVHLSIMFNVRKTTYSNDDVTSWWKKLQKPVPNMPVSYFIVLFVFLQRVSIACYAERCISHSKSVRPCKGVDCLHYITCCIYYIIGQSKVGIV